MPPFLQVMRSCEPEFRTTLFQQLGQLVARVKQHIRDYLPEIFKLIHDYWKSNSMVHIITLVEEISIALSDEFKLHISELLPQVNNMNRIRSANGKKVVNDTLYIAF